jgi:hypothetical protein
LKKIIKVKAMTRTTVTNLYNSDFALWVEDTVNKLKAKKLDRVDWENLIEEIESLGKREKRELESRLTTLFEHALKRAYIPLPDCYRRWESTLKRTQKELKKILRDSPSLRKYFLEMIDECYEDAVDNLIEEYDVVFPNTCPFLEKEIVNEVDLPASTSVIEVLLTSKFWQSKK